MCLDCRDLERQKYEVTYLKPDRAGRAAVEQVATALRLDTVLVSMMLVNQVYGAQAIDERPDMCYNPSNHVFETSLIRG